MVSTRTRMSAEERRESVIRAAVTEFARNGYHGTSTEAIARRVGVSQPYLFRLFPGKLALFKAAAARCFERTAATFEQAAEGLSGEEALAAMGEAYSNLVRDRDVLLLQMQLYVTAASSENPEVSQSIRDSWRSLWDIVRVNAGASDEELRDFFATGMLINTLVALGIPGGDRCWAGLDDACKVAASQAPPAVPGGEGAQPPEAPEPRTPR